jgi:F-type H+-transporting ATPase subunit b
MDAFGINITSITIYLVLFALLYVVIDRYLIKNLVRTIEKRQEEIDKGLKLTEDVEKRMTDIEQEYQVRMEEAAKEVRELIANAKKQGAEMKSAEVEKGKKEAESIVAKASQTIDTERESLKKEIKSEVSDIVADALTKVIEEDATDDVKKKLTDKAIANL